MNKPQIYYFDAKFSLWWRTKEEAKMNSIEPVAVVNYSAYQELERKLEIAIKTLKILKVAVNDKVKDPGATAFDKTLREIEGE